MPAALYETTAPTLLAWPHAAGGSSQVARRAHNPKVAGSNPAPAIGRKPAYQAGFRVFGRPQNRPKNALGQRLGQHEVRERSIPTLAQGFRSSYVRPRETRITAPAT